MDLPFAYFVKSTRRMTIPKLNRKQTIAQTALSLFAEKGYEQTSTQLIAKAAQVSEALLFKHYGTKEALLEHVITTGYKRVIEQLRGRLQGADALTLIHRVIELPLQLVAEEPEFWKVQSRLFDSELSRQQHARFLQPLPGLLQQAFRQLGFAQPAEEGRLLLLVVDALWKHQANETDESLGPLLALLKRKYAVQAQALAGA